MDLRTIPRIAIDRYLSSVKLPLDVSARLFRRGQSPSPAELAIDRWDAGVRDVAGRLLRDDQLRQDAARRRTAADERERALRLRSEANARHEQADQELQDRKQSAEQLRDEAERKAEQRKQEAAAERQEQQRQVDEAERRRKEANAEATEAARKATEDQARRARLEELDAEAEALAERERELTAKDEATRLQDAAASAKSARKNGRR